MSAFLKSRVLFVCVALAFALDHATIAQASGDEPPESIAEFLEYNCIGCHDTGTSEGDLDLESLKVSLEDPENFHLWERVFDRVKDGEMPPDESLDDSETAPFLSQLKDTLHQFDSRRISTSGRVHARRLTRHQYERNVRQLLAINIPLSDYLPAESMNDGFDTVSKSQQISDHSMAAYLKSADAALDLAFQQALAASPAWDTHLDWRKLRRNERRNNREPEGRPKHQDIVSWSTRQNFYGRMSKTAVPETGMYRVRINTHAVNRPKDKNIWCSVQSGVCSGKASTMYWVGKFEADDEATVHEFEAWIRKDHILRVVPNDQSLRKVAVNILNRPAGTVEPMGVPGVAIDWIEIEQLKPETQQVQQALFGRLPIKLVQPKTKQRKSKQQPPANKFRVVPKNLKSDLKKLILDFAQRAFRRPVSETEIEPYQQFALQQLEKGKPFVQALRSGYRTILCSPRFLYFEESPGELDGYALASRLSHFIWGQSPDQKLIQLAQTGQLKKPDILRKQTERLLNDSRAVTFVREFTDQWLKLYELNSTTPDGKLYPEYDDILHHSLQNETHAFVWELISKNLPAGNLVDSNFTFLNSRLARHYDIAWPGGQGFKRVALPADSHRGGLITHASILKVTANGTSTSPVVRGIWMLEQIMGQHVPPPPANVSAVEPDIRGATTIRAQLDKHRDLDSCAACHVKIDPPGFALESYDVVGGWRENYRKVNPKKRGHWVKGLPVDPSHRLTSGEKFKDIDQLKKLLLRDPKPIARNLAAQFVSYATGARPTFADRDDLDSIVDAAEASNYGARSILHEVVQSRLFRNK